MALASDSESVRLGPAVRSESTGDENSSRLTMNDARGVALPGRASRFQVGRYAVGGLGRHDSDTRDGHGPCHCDFQDPQAAAHYNCCTQFRHKLVALCWVILRCPVSVRMIFVYKEM